MLIETESHSQNELLSNCLPILNVRRKRRTTTLLIPVAVRADWRVFLRRSRRILLLRRERSRQRILREGSLVRWHGWLLTYRVFSLVRWHGSSLSSGGIARPSSSLGLTETESRCEVGWRDGQPVFRYLPSLVVKKRHGNVRAPYSARTDPLCNITDS